MKAGLGLGPPRPFDRLRGARAWVGLDLTSPSRPRGESTRSPSFPCTLSVVVLPADWIDQYIRKNLRGFSTKYSDRSSDPIQAKLGTHLRKQIRLGLERFVSGSRQGVTRKLIKSAPSSDQFIRHLNSALTSDSSDELARWCLFAHDMNACSRMPETHLDPMVRKAPRLVCWVIAGGRHYYRSSGAKTETHIRGYLKKLVGDIPGFPTLLHELQTGNDPFETSMETPANAPGFPAFSTHG